MKSRWVSSSLMLVLTISAVVCFAQSNAGPAMQGQERPSVPPGESSFDFRKTSWGMSPAQVKASESEKPSDETDLKGKYLLSYKGVIAGFEASTLYIFVGGKLVRAKYLFLEEHTDETDFISDYNAIKDSMSQKYGKPESDQVLWNNDLYKDDPQNWGTAVSVGHLSYFASWETPATSIILDLTGDNFEVDLEVEYSSKELKHLEEEADQKAKAREF